MLTQLLRLKTRPRISLCPGRLAPKLGRVDPFKAQYREIISHVIFSYDREKKIILLQLASLHSVDVLPSPSNELAKFTT